MSLLAASTDPAWWESFLQYGLTATVVAVVGFVTVVLQNRWNNARETERRAEDLTERRQDRDFHSSEAKAERDHALALIQEQRDADRDAALVVRRHELEDHWREERRQAHLRLLQGLEGTVAKSENGIGIIRTHFAKPGNDDYLDEDDKCSLTMDELHDLRGALADVLILGSENARVRAQDAFDRVVDLDSKLFWVHGWSKEKEIGLRGRARECRVSMTTYADAVRRDIGTSDDGAASS